MNSTFDLGDGLGLAGLALVTAGVWFVYWPLALIVPGAVLFALGVRWNREGA